MSYKILSIKTTTDEKPEPKEGEIIYYLKIRDAPAVDELWARYKIEGKTREKKVENIPMIFEPKET